MFRPKQACLLATIPLLLDCAHQDLSSEEGSAYGGASSGGGGTTNVTTVFTPPTSELLISEIMYHPVNENSATDEHEFVEIHNTGSEPIAVAGWRLHVGKSDRLTLPEGTTINGGDYLVLAKNRDKLLAISRYALSADKVIGDFEGNLDNGG